MKNLVLSSSLIEVSSRWPWWQAAGTGLLLIAIALGTVVLADKAENAPGVAGASGCVLYLVALVLVAAGLALLGYALVG